MVFGKTITKDINEEEARREHYSNMATKIRKHSRSAAKLFKGMAKDSGKHAKKLSHLRSSGALD